MTDKQTNGIDEGVIGCCDICGCPIFDYERHTMNEDGIMAHSSCVEEEVIEIEKDFDDD